MAAAIPVGINGFGRIGKLATRISEKTETMVVVAINDPFMTVEDIVYSLKYDSTHGIFEGTIEAGEDGESVVVNGRTVSVTQHKDPKDCDWGSRGVRIVVDCSGAFKTVPAASAHLEGGAEKVVISAPSKDAQMYVLGVNSDEFDSSLQVVSNASCTTNCLAPLIKVVHEAYGVEEALMTTVHACTASQRIVDLNNSKKHRLGRSGMTNIIPSTTGAAMAVAKVYPAMDGKMTGMSMRVPTADVSVVDVCIKLEKPASLDDIQAALQAAADGPMAGILQVCTDEIVSSDVAGNTHSCVYDAGSSLAISDRFVKLIAFYDNEYAYAARLGELVALAGAPQ